MGSEASIRRVFLAAGLSAAVGWAASACGSPHKVRPYPLAEPMWEDAGDTRPFPGKVPKRGFEGATWDAANQTILRPIARFWAVDPGSAAADVNAFDEVPTSSWFVNRLGHREMTPGEIARGACTGEPLDPAGPWLVTGAKPDGAAPGFVIKAADGRRYLIKFDGLLQPERATAADVVGALIYHAVGYHAPCNQVVFFDKAALKIKAGATAERLFGDEEPLAWHHIDAALAKGTLLPDGRYRATASAFVDGIPIGLWRYQDVRKDDPNDVIPHEDRRELRASYLLAAWLNRFDSREQNTLAAWIDPEGDGSGYVRHYFIDFGDCLGQLWENDVIGRRFGYSYYLDVPHMVGDLVSLGTVRRKYDTVKLGTAGKIFGYWNVEDFEASKWRPGYPNPAFMRMTEADAAWMARRLAHFDDAHISALVDAARLARKVDREELRRILTGRLEKIKARWLTRLSPLMTPRIVPGAGGAELCLRDAAVVGHVVHGDERTDSGHAWVGGTLREAGALTTRRLGDGTEVCVGLPATGGTSASPESLVVDVVARGGGTREAPLRAHLYHLGGVDYRVVGLERPAMEKAPRL